MKKWLASIMILGLVVVAFVPVRTLFAAPADETLEQEVLVLRRQIHELRKQIIDKHVAAGKLAAEEAELRKQQLDERFEWHVQHGFEKKPSCPNKEWKGKSKELKPKLRRIQEGPMRQTE